LEVRTVDFEIRITHVSRFTRDGLWRWWTFVASC
jgi:hypothetical protein